MCQLCDREVRNPTIYEDDLYWVTTCITCGVPLIVLKRHTTSMNPAELARLPQIVGVLADIGVTGDLDCTMRQIPDHFHCHLR